MLDIAAIEARERSARAIAEAAYEAGFAAGAMKYRQLMLEAQEWITNTPLAFGERWNSIRDFDHA